MNPIITNTLIEEQNLNMETVVKIDIKNLKNCAFVDGVELVTGNEIRYLIYDCSVMGDEIELEKLRKINDEQTGISVLVMAFKNWKHERDIYWKNWDVKGAGTKTEVKKLFKKKISIYTDGGGIIELATERDGINYLEYTINENNPESKLEGYIYNISFFELEKLFNVTGINLFKKNVRNGKEKDSTGEKLRKTFKGYLHVYIFNALKNKISLDDERLPRLKEILDIDDEMLKYSAPENFWFFHNGITLFSFDDAGFNRTGNKIRLNSKKVSVINGAQTLTGLCMKLEEVQRKTYTMLEELGGICTKGEIIELAEEACKLLRFKMNIIQGKEDFVHSITTGLNLQIPILGEDIIAISDDVVEINSILKRGGIQVTRAGEDSELEYGIDVLEFVKKYLNIIGKPGESKNLNKKKLELYVSEALSYLKNDESNEESFIDNFIMLKYLDGWWQSTKKQREIECKEETEKIVNLYGKLYFGSYLIVEELKDNSAEMFQLSYYKFLELIFQVNDIVNLESFKNDTLFRKLIIELDKQKSNTTLLLDSLDLDKLKIRLNESINSPYTLSRIVEKFLKESNVSVDYYRVINRLEDKCKEAFPFPSSSFSELYLNKEFDGLGLSDENNAEWKYREFDQSKWYTELVKEYPIFVIDREKEGKGGGEKIVSVELIKKFSFYDYLDKAETVYKRTVQSFIDGDELELPKVSDGLKFHVRPKAINADDTFEFSNGEQITKRTFWANRDTVESLIKKKIEQIN